MKRLSNKTTELNNKITPIDPEQVEQAENYDPSEVHFTTDEKIKLFYNKHTTTVRMFFEGIAIAIGIVNPYWGKIVDKAADFIKPLKIAQNGGKKMEFLKGKKTYIVAGLFLLTGILWLTGAWQVPETIWAIIAALGFGAVRAALADLSGNAGWKTYVAVIATIAISGVDLIGFNIPVDIINLIYTVTGSLGIVGIRDAVKKLNT